jgi:hypothetical protein
MKKTLGETRGLNDFTLKIEGVPNGVFVYLKDELLRDGNGNQVHTGTLYTSFFIFK